VLRLSAFCTAGSFVVASSALIAELRPSKVGQRPCALGPWRRCWWCGAVFELAASCARISLSARVSCLLRVRTSGSGDWEGAGAVIAVGRSDGVVALLDSLSLATLVTWETPGRLCVYSLDVSPSGAFLVAGCAQGTLAVFALQRSLSAFLLTLTLMLKRVSWSHLLLALLHLVVPR